MQIGICTSVASIEWALYRVAYQFVSPINLSRPMNYRHRVKHVFRSWQPIRAVAVSAAIFCCTILPLAGKSFLDSNTFESRLLSPDNNKKPGVENLKPHLTIPDNVILAVIGDSTTRNMLEQMLHPGSNVNATIRDKWKVGRHNMIDGLWETKKHVFQYFPLVLPSNKNLPEYGCGNSHPKNSMFHALEHVNRHILGAVNATGKGSEGIKIYFIFGGISLTAEDVLRAITWYLSAEGDDCGPTPSLRYEFVVRTNGPTGFNSKGQRYSANSAISGLVASAAGAFQNVTGRAQSNVRQGFTRGKSWRMTMWNTADYLESLWPDGVIDKKGCMCHWNSTIDSALGDKFKAHIFT